ncbi:MAG: stage 0 sporulation protein [Elusimicrobiota bacterium]|jgi:cell fate regulator YaaT (PSP1 superfamily)|nr:stage 0 sporulation protein [Elusimicrobiota bacterium]
MSLQVVGVTVRSLKEIEYADTSHFELNVGEKVIVETNHGLEYGTVCEKEKVVEARSKDFSKIVRKLSEFDKKRIERNEQKNAQTRIKVIQSVAKHNLDMKLTAVEYTFDRSKLFVYYTSESRVDFRELIKDLGHDLKTRIQMVQIGMRDNAKIVGGIGTCGQTICCKTFLKDFTPVTIEMAKEQDLSLNSSKLVGLCERLMCCIAYESDYYAKVKKELPDIGTIILTPGGKAKLVAIDCIKLIVTVDIGNRTFKNYTVEEIKKGNPK